MPHRNVLTPCGAILAVLIGTLASPAVRANVSIDAVTQSPQNNVTPGQAVSYSIAVSSDAGQGATDFVAFTVSLNGTDITAQFTPVAPCSFDGQIYCNGSGVTASSPQTYQLTWNNPAPAAGSYTVTFQATCSTSDGTSNPPPCSGGSAPVSTVVSSQTPQQTTTQLRTLPGLTANQHAVAVAVDRLCADAAGAQLQTLCAQLSSLSTSEQTKAVQQITPGEVASQGTNAFVSTYTQLANIRMRLMVLRQGVGGMSANNLSLGIQGRNLPAGRLLAALLKGHNGGGAGADRPVGERLGVFVNGRVNFGARGTTANETGFSFDTHGVTAGMDYRFTDRLVAGGAFGFASTSNQFGADSGHMNARDYSLSTYGSYYLPMDAFVDWIATYSTNHYDIVHHIAFTGVDTRTDAGVGGDQFALAVNAGEDFHRGGLTLTPYARVEYIATAIDAYREGGGNLAVVIDHQSLKYLTSVLASRLSKAISMSWGILSPSIHLEWVHQYDNNSRLISGHFVGDPGASFAIRSDSPDRDYFNAGFGLAVTLPRGISGFFNYETVLARNHIRNTLMQVGARMQF